jgi:hypothetical protein
MRNFKTGALGAFAFALFAPGAMAQLSMNWFTIDGGGGTSSNVGGLSLGFTVGQPDAGPPMTGGALTFTGGFWVGGTGGGSPCGSADFDCDGDIGTDADIESFFACLAGSCPPPPCTSNADFNGDGDIGTDADIEAFFRVLAGGDC